MNEQLERPSLRKLIPVLLKEKFLRPQIFERRPEPELIMDSLESAMAFHEQGSKYLRPVYHFNSYWMSQLTPPKAHILDLGSGSGQYLMYFALRRPDVRITAVDFSDAMIELGKAKLHELGLQERIQFIKGDMRELTHLAPQKLDLLSSHFAFHHLPTKADLMSCLSQVVKIQEKSPFNLWFFDFVRPLRNDTVQQFPEIFTKGSSDIFKEDTRHSLLAAFSFDEMLESLREAQLQGVISNRSKDLPFYQAHSKMSLPPGFSAGHSNWQKMPINQFEKQTFLQLCKMFKSHTDQQFKMANEGT